MRAYNPCMLHALNTLVAPALLQRVTLVLNHVLGAEPMAVQRLSGHVGRVVVVVLDGWPSLLPPPPHLAFRITPAGLLDWIGEQAPAATADLQILVDASNPALLAVRAVSGQQPSIDVIGDAALAADLNWLLDNVRWDAEADLERVVGAPAASQLTRFGRMLGNGFQTVLKQGGDLVSRLRPRGTERTSP